MTSSHPNATQSLTGSQHLSGTEAFVLADQALDTVVQQIRDDQWDLTLPDQFGHPEVEPKTLRDALADHAKDEAWMPDMLAGKTIDEVGASAYDGDLLGDDPRAGYHALVEKGVAAAQAVTDQGQTVHFSYGDFPVREGIWHVTTFRALRAVELARLLGVDDTLDPALVEAMWEELVPQAEGWRAMGVFGPAVAVPEEAPLQQRMLGLTGRQPTA